MRISRPMTCSAPSSCMRLRSMMQSAAVTSLALSKTWKTSLKEPEPRCLPRQCRLAHCHHAASPARTVLNEHRLSPQLREGLPRLALPHRVNRERAPVGGQPGGKRGASLARSTDPKRVPVGEGSRQLGTKGEALLFLPSLEFPKVRVEAHPGGTRPCQAQVRGAPALSGGRWQTGPLSSRAARGKRVAVREGPVQHERLRIVQVFSF
eukprot:scaffold2224_cov261-Pinguiococcus_pyrenoidosus.AAC.26